MISKLDIRHRADPSLSRGWQGGGRHNLACSVQPPFTALPACGAASGNLGMRGCPQTLKAFEPRPARIWRSPVLPAAAHSGERPPQDSGHRPLLLAPSLGAFAAAKAGKVGTDLHKSQRLLGVGREGHLALQALTSITCLFQIRSFLKQGQLSGLGWFKRIWLLFDVLGY